MEGLSSFPIQAPNRRQARLVIVLLLLSSTVVYHIANYTSSYEKEFHEDETFSFSKRLKLSAISLLRVVIFPLLRHPIRCIPPYTKVANVTIDMASIYYRQGEWTEELRQIFQLSEKNKAEYVTINEHYMINLHNGSRWANENMGRLSHINNTWFKPVFVRELVKNMTVENRTRPDWIIYLDSDIIILNQNFDLRRLITLSGGNMHDELSMILSTDADGINSGAFLIRVNESGLKIMDAWIKGHESGKDDQSYLNSIFDDDGFLLQVPSENNMNNALIPRMKLVRPCALNAGGGIERKPGKWWPYFEGVYCK
ncbi:hypothetical protein ACHAWX_002685, partial [Stephanocyclus meneghinianus]